MLFFFNFFLKNRKYFYFFIFLFLSYFFFLKIEILFFNTNNFLLSDSPTVFLKNIEDTEGNLSNNPNLPKPPSSVEKAKDQALGGTLAGINSIMGILGTLTNLAIKFGVPGERHQIGTAIFCLIIFICHNGLVVHLSGFIFHLVDKYAPASWRYSKIFRIAFICTIFIIPLVLFSMFSFIYRGPKN